MTPVTQQLDQFDILRALIGELAAQSASVRDTIGQMRIESKEQHGEFRAVVQALATQVDSVVVEVNSLKMAIEELRQDGRRVELTVQDHTIRIKTLESALSSLEHQIEQIRSIMAEDRNTVRRALEEAAVARKQETEAVMAHMTKLEHALNSAGERRDGEIAKVTEAMSAVVDELGIEDRVELGRTLPKGEKAKPRLQQIDSLERRAKSNQIVQIIIAIGFIAELISSVLHK